MSETQSGKHSDKRSDKSADKAGSSRSRSDKASSEQPASGEQAQAFAERAQELAGTAVDSSQGLVEHASKLIATFQQGHQELGRRLADGSAQRPYAAAGAALGVGFVLGGGLTFALTRRLVVFGGRMAMSMAMRKIVENAAHVAV